MGRGRQPRPAAVVAPQSVALLVDRIPKVAARTGTPRGERFTVGIRATGPDREFLLEVGECVSMTAVPPGPAGANGASVPWIAMPAEALLRLVYGRLDPGHTPVVRRLSGPVDLDLLRGTFPGF